MPTAIEITDPYIETYTRWSCTQTVGQVSRPVELVVPISLTELWGQLHHVLRSYKNPAYPASVRDRFRVQVSALLTRFLGQHGDCIRRAADQDWNAITIVPSSRARMGVHPLEDAIRMSRLLSDLYLPLLRPGAEKANHNHAADGAYAFTGKVKDLRALVLDDTFTSGARGQSAASALQLAGARVVALVPIGRVINRDFSAEAAALLDRACQEPFDFDVCCLEG